MNLPEKVMGRPRKELDVEAFEEMCFYQCTLEEICAFFRMTDDTLNERLMEIYGETFSIVFRKLSKGGHISLRRSLFQNAIKNQYFPAQKFLAQNHLGMSEKIDTTNVNINKNEYEFLRPGSEEQNQDQTAQTNARAEKVKSE